MKYYVQDNVHTIECSVDEFSLVLVNQRKQAIKYDTFTNANFFGSYNEPGEAFTLPAGHLVADYASDSEWVRHYCEERGKFIDDKFYFDSNTWRYGNQFYQKSLSTFVIENNKAKIVETQSLSDTYQYAVSGVPVMRKGADVKFYGDVTGQGYDASTLYSTKHIFIALKKNDAKIYVLGYKTTTSNMVYSGEIFKKLSGLGYYDAIKLDGGGSYHFKVRGEVKDTTSENRRINAVIKITPKIEYPGVSDWAEDAWTEYCDMGFFEGKNPQNIVTREMLSVILDKFNLKTGGE